MIGSSSTNRRCRSRRAVLGVAVALVLAACGPAADRDRGSLTFGGCDAALGAELARFSPDLAEEIELGCGELGVPLDYARPAGEQITLRIIRARHQQQSDRIGSVIFHPGGPGEPGLEYTPFLLSWLPAAVLRRFDLVSLDPRGTGGSAPINCPAVPDAPGTTSPNVLTDAGFARAAALERQQSRACLQVLSSRASSFSTETAARDVDRLRAAIGDRALSFIGGSYGAKLGAEYARQFPSLGARRGPGRTVGAQHDLVREQRPADQGLRGHLRRVRRRLRSPAAVPAG